MVRSMVRPMVSGDGLFSPIQLFANSEQGAWYDPSDLTTLYQTSTGTTPVTADGQPVGLVLDKSRGLELGDELVTNGTFDTDSDWYNDAGWSITNGDATCSGGGRMFQPIPLLEYKRITVQVTFEIIEITAGKVVVDCYGVKSQGFNQVGIRLGVTPVTRH